MRRRRHRSARGQTMVEFIMVLPVFLLLVLGLIDYSGYFGARLSVESAARNGARVAAVQSQSDYTSGSAGAAIIAKVVGTANDASLPSGSDCTWEGTTLSPTHYPPFSLTGNGCIGIWYFELQTNGPPQLCAQWSVAGHWDTWTDGTESVDQSTVPDGCVAAGSDVVVVGVGYRFSALTPLPAVASSALMTYGETQLLEEQ